MLPASAYLILVVLFFITSVLNNWAFDFNIPVPLHMIFRSVCLCVALRARHTKIGYLEAPV